VIGVESQVALEKKIIAKPETWKKSAHYKQYLYEPVCPKGYSKTSAYPRYSISNKADLNAAFKNADRHIHCLKDEYWIGRKAAEEKFGIKVIHIPGVRERFYDGNNHYTPSNYMTVPNEFHLKSAYANFDLGITDDTYYPAHHSLTRDREHKLINFGHNHFYFYGE